MIRRGIFLLIATLSMLPLRQIPAAGRQLLPVSEPQAHGTSVNVIFDTDMYSDIDDIDKTVGGMITRSNSRGSTASTLHKMR